ncbi:MAG TPA: hypothetical protein PJ982_12215 [Lacipirellulaceae bacterium]|nr:hypothetical protein [Lacipirellulaceae bacterium]
MTGCPGQFKGATLASILEVDPSLGNEQTWIGRRPETTVAAPPLGYYNRRLGSAPQ